MKILITGFAFWSLLALGTYFTQSKGIGAIWSIIWLLNVRIYMKG